MPRRGTTPQRGYGYRHRKLRERWQATIDREGGYTCWRHGDHIPPGNPDAWDLGHDDTDRTIYRGPECRTGNRSNPARWAKRRQAREALTDEPRADDEPQSRDW
jgi:hypothetical protein